MKDDILKSYLSNFIEQNQLEGLKQDEAFERFVNFNIVSKLYPREIEIEDLSTGGTDDLAIDGVAIIVNGNIIKSKEEIDYFIENNGTLDVTFAFIQSKNSSKFRGEQVGNFIFGVKSFFDEKPSIPENGKIQNLREIKEKIYQNSIIFEDLPELKLFFVTTGTWEEPSSIAGKVTRELSELDKRSLFKNSAEIEFYDANRLKNTYREMNRKSIKEIAFNNHVALPEMPNELKVRQAFIGSVPVKAYLDLITDQDNNLSKGLFYDNIRDYQGDNKVNKEIKSTLQSSVTQALLPLLNNGITIIAKKIDRIGTKLKLTDFQIVNGCQSSHVLFDNKTVISEDTHIILKLIDTTDQDVINKIIRATNRQTEVKDEAFESLKPFHKDLEELYKALSSSVKPPIYYERRSKEYFGDPKVKPWQVITLASQIKAYVAIILAQPQSVHRYFGELLESNKGKLFTNTSHLKKYYISTLLLNRLETLFKNNTIRKKYRPFKYHIAYLTYLKLKQEKMQDQDMIDFASDKENLIDYFIEACKIIAKVLKAESYSNNIATRSREFTNKLRDSMNR